MEQERAAPKLGICLATEW